MIEYILFICPIGTLLYSTLLYSTLLYLFPEKLVRRLLYSKSTAYHGRGVPRPRGLISEIYEGIYDGSCRGQVYRFINQLCVR